MQKPIRMGDMQTFLFANEWRTLPPVEELHPKLTPTGLRWMDCWQADRFAALAAEGIEWSMCFRCPADKLPEQCEVEETVLLDALDALLRNAWRAVCTACPRGHRIDTVCSLSQDGVYEFDFYDDGEPPDPELLEAFAEGGVYGFYTLALLILRGTGASLYIGGLPKQESSRQNAVKLRFDRLDDAGVF